MSWPRPTLYEGCSSKERFSLISAQPWLDLATYLHLTSPHVCLFFTELCLQILIVTIQWPTPRPTLSISPHKHGSFENGSFGDLLCQNGWKFVQGSFAFDRWHLHQTYGLQVKLSFIMTREISTSEWCWALMHIPTIRVIGQPLQ